MTAPRLLEVLGAVPTPPAGFTPNYFTNEFLEVPEPELSDYSMPNIERPGYKILSSWTPEGGLRLFIDHENDEPFTTAEIRDLIATLQDTIGEAVNAAEATEG